MEDECAGVQAEPGGRLFSVFGLLDCTLEQVAFLRMEGLQTGNANSTCKRFSAFALCKA